ncbi:MAG: hypothetical protein DI640_05110 [Sphingomonas taxi]|uniref:Uncharacterized protein n=1 Tax=Sphingomonas taxi TaxID=1549858 RepID=A0A2W4Z1P3_9SPHN|nr:MAG: hypothetical protein DI640_05110 [Sphingomonas taxi]
MADTDTPDTEAKKPAARRKVPRKASAPKAAPAASSVKPVAAKPVPVAKPAADKPVPAAPPKPVAKPAPKPRSTKRSTPRPVSARKAVTPVAVATLPEKIRGKWGAAAIFSGVAVAGAAVGALLTLRGSTPKVPLKSKGKQAHQADGADSSKSFEAGIADPGTVPE